MEDAQGNRAYPLIRRDMQAPVLPGYYTFGLGRCGEHPAVTATQEGEEEVLIIIKNQVAILPAPQGFENVWAERKKQQIESKGDILKNAGYDVDALLCSGFVTMSYREAPEEKHLFKDVSVHVCGKRLRKFRAIPLWGVDRHDNNRAYNTMEFIRIARLTVDSFDEVKVFDGEELRGPNGSIIRREAGLYDEPFLSKPEVKMTPALDWYVLRRAVP